MTSKLVGVVPMTTRFPELEICRIVTLLNGVSRGSVAHTGIELPLPPVPAVREMAAVTSGPHVFVIVKARVN